MACRRGWDFRVFPLHVFLIPNISSHDHVLGLSQLLCLSSGSFSFMGIGTARGEKAILAVIGKCHCLAGTKVKQHLWASLLEFSHNLVGKRRHEFALCILEETEQMLVMTLQNLSEREKQSQLPDSVYLRQVCKMNSIMPVSKIAVRSRRWIWIFVSSRAKSSACPSSIIPVPVKPPVQRSCSLGSGCGHRFVSWLHSNFFPACKVKLS